jgi:DNA-binding CsgD family transcriptional regulator
MLPYAYLEFEGSHHQAKKRLPVNPAKYLKGLQPQELIPIIIRVITYILMHPQEFWIIIQIGGSGNAIDRLYAEVENTIANRPATIYFTNGELRMIRATRQGLKGEQLLKHLNIKAPTAKKYRQQIYEKICGRYNKPHDTSTIIWYAKMVGIE